MALLSAYLPYGTDTDAVSVTTADVLAGQDSIPSLALIIHELATNSAKYGALSGAGRKLGLACTDTDEDVELIWSETGHLPRDRSVKHDGFGSMLTERVVKQIGGSLTRRWTDDGLIVTLRMSKARLGA